MPALVTTRSPVFRLPINFCCCSCRFFCGLNHHKIHDDENENKRDEKRANAAAGHRSRRSRLSLSENHAEHIENWRAHLKHERARCNRSFASLVLVVVCLALWLLSGISASEPLTERQRKRRGLVRQLDGAKLVSVDEKSAARANLTVLMTGV